MAKFQRFFNKTLSLENGALCRSRRHSNEYLVHFATIWLQSSNLDAELKIVAHDTRSFLSVAQPGSRAQQANIKKPRKSKVVASDRGVHSKNRNSREMARKGDRTNEGFLTTGWCHLGTTETPRYEVLY